MARMNADGDSSKNKTQLSTRVDADLKAAFKRAADANGENMTDAVDQLLREYIDDAGEAVDGGYPADTTLESGYRALRQRADPDTLRLGTETAESVVAQATSVPSDGVRREVLDPLERRGFIEYQWGVIQVVEPAAIQSDGSAAVATDGGQRDD